MKQYPEVIFLTDDSAARLVGKQLGYKVHGTLGVLIRTIRRELMSPQTAAFNCVLVMGLILRSSTSSSKEIKSG